LTERIGGPVVFEHPAVRKSWLSYQIRRDEEEEDSVVIATVLHVETLQPDLMERNPEGWDEFTDALASFLFDHDDIESVEIVPPNQT
jgi:hypothetical protein